MSTRDVDVADVSRTYAVWARNVYRRLLRDASRPMVIATFGGETICDRLRMMRRPGFAQHSRRVGASGGPA